MLRRRVFAIVLLMALPLTGVVVTAPVSAQTPPTIDITSATLIAKGAAVDVGLTVNCEVGYSYYYSGVTLTQRSSKLIAQGSGSSSEIVTCNGQPQTVTARVTASANGSTAFKKGTALAQAYMQLCGPFDCPYVTVSKTISIGK